MVAGRVEEREDDSRQGRWQRGGKSRGWGTRHRSLSMLITEANVNHDRPGARPGKVGKLLLRLARARARGKETTLAAG